MPIKSKLVSFSLTGLLIKDLCGFNTEIFSETFVLNLLNIVSEIVSGSR